MRSSPSAQDYAMFGDRVFDIAKVSTFGRSWQSCHRQAAFQVGELPFLLSKQAPDYPAVVRIRFPPEGARQDCYSLLEEDLNVQHFFSSCVEVRDNECLARAGDLDSDQRRFARLQSARADKLVRSCLAVFPCPAEDAHTVGIIEVPVAGRPLAAAILPCFPTAAIPGSF